MGTFPFLAPLVPHRRRVRVLCHCQIKPRKPTVFDWAIQSPELLEGE